MWNEIKLTNKEMTEILTSFDSLFNQKYERELQNTLPLNELNLTNEAYLKSDEEVDYVMSSEEIKIPVNRQSGLYYFTTQKNQSERLIQRNKIIKIKTFYQNFVPFFKAITGLSFKISSKQDLIETLKKLPKSIDLEKDKSILLRFIKELYTILNYKLNITPEQICIELIERFDLYILGIAKRNYNINDFELHKAVYKGNFVQVSKILGLNKTDYCNIFNDINEVDSNDNTPLFLALKMNNADMVKVLCDHGANIKLKSFDDLCSPFEYALKNKMEKMLRIFVNSFKNQSYNNWELNKSHIFNTLSSLPNFQMKLKLDFDSMLLTLFSKSICYDSYEISKLNDDIKIELNVNRTDSDMKGKSTIWVQTNNQKIIKINHTKNKVYDYIENIFSDKDEDKKVDSLLKEGKVNTKMNINNFDIKMQRHRENIIGYNCNTYKIKGDVVKEKEYISNLESNAKEEDFNFEKISFEEYFSKGIAKIKENSKRQGNKFKSTNLGINIKDSEIARESIYNDKNCVKNKVNKLPTPISIKNQRVAEKKDFDVDVWLCKDFPFSIKHIFPLVNILSLKSNDFSLLQSSITQKLLPFESFPLKISFLVYLTYHAQLTLVHFSLRPPSIRDFNQNLKIKTQSYVKKGTKGNTSKKELEPLNYDFYEAYYSGLNNVNYMYEEEDEEYITQRIREFPKNNKEEVKSN